MPRSATGSRRRSRRPAPRSRRWLKRSCAHFRQTHGDTCDRPSAALAPDRGGCARLRRTPAFAGSCAKRVSVARSVHPAPLRVRGRRAFAAKCRRCPASISCRWTRRCKEARGRRGRRAGGAALRPARGEGRTRRRGLRRPTVRCSTPSAPFAPRRRTPSIITDVCLCEYTSHGHCGLVVGDDIVNDATVEQLVARRCRTPRRGPTSSRPPT